MKDTRDYAILSGMKTFENIDEPAGAGPWYVAGLAFECLQCGQCCAGPEEGFVWASDEEITAVAEFLKMGEKEFRLQYVRRVGLRRSFVENRKTHDCVFLKDGGCTIYPVRPMQCRTWPFWKSNIASPEDWSWAARRCSGVNRGPLHSVDEINSRAGLTRE
jgi:Fe-S-cluster containining protein